MYPLATINELPFCLVLSPPGRFRYSVAVVWTTDHVLLYMYVIGMIQYVIDLIPWSTLD